AGMTTRVIAFDASLHLTGATAAERDQLLGLAAWADPLSVSWIRVFDGGGRADAAEVAEMAATIRGWRGGRKERRWRTDLMVETHDSLLTVGALERFVAAIPDVAILWDSHHTWRKGGSDPAAIWRVGRRHVVHVHVKDSINVPSARHPFTYVL